MSLVSHRTVHDQHGTPHTVTRVRCDGPDCERTIESNDRLCATWGAMLGFVNIDDAPDFDERPANGDWCSVRCLAAWAAALYAPA